MVGLMAGRRIRRGGWAGRIFMLLLLFLVVLPACLLVIFRVLPVPGTPQMLFSLVSGEGAHYAWRDGFNPALARAVIGSEDQNFCSHHGFDWEEIDKALADHDRGGRLRGASTISQQTARTLFLGYRGGWVRKGLETYLTVLVEMLWPKKRILEAYLNLVDWGHGNFGAEAASRAYFHIGAGRLNRVQAARLAAVLPDPDKWNAAQPGPYVAERGRFLVGQAAVVARDGLDSCIK
jgi:monofunctional biosynthetic peptidoglycan transglycosylase